MQLTTLITTALLACATPEPSPPITHTFNHIPEQTINHGYTLYHRLCAPCHGDDGNGRIHLTRYADTLIITKTHPLAPTPYSYLTKLLDTGTETNIQYNHISIGTRTMPILDLPYEDRKALAIYINSTFKKR